MKFRQTAAFGVLAALLALSAAGRANAQTKAAGPDQAVKDVLTALADNKPVALWQALPTSYQTDVKGLITEAAGKLDAEVYDKGFAVLRKAIKLLKDKKEIILKSDYAKGAQATPLDQKKLGDAYDAVVGVLDTLATSELSKLDELKKADVEKFLSGTGAKLMKQFSAFDQFVDKSKMKDGTSSVTSLPAFFKGVKVTVVKSDAKEATLKIESPEGKKPEEKVFVKVEGKWVPKDMADDWTSDIKKAKEALAGAPAVTKETKQMALGLLGSAEQGIDKLAAAKTTEEFQKAVQEIVGSFLSPK